MKAKISKRSYNKFPYKPTTYRKTTIAKKTMKNHHFFPPQTTTIQACSACRYQRRKCTPDCLLAPYFPHDRQKQFQNAHKLFGVSNISKLIKNLDKFQKDEAMRTVIYESDVRAFDPVGGCFRIVKDLYTQIETTRVELEYVLQQLALCRTNGGKNNHEIGIDEIDYDIRDEYKDEDGFVWEDKNVVEPIQAWPVVKDSQQPLHMLHASVCDDFKSLLIHENEPREENMLDGGNEKGLIKAENVCYNEEEYGTKNASFGIMSADCKAIQVVGK